MRIKIKVTQEHIDKGIRLSPQGCPISLALSSALGRPRIPVADIYFRWPGYDVDNKTVWLPKTAIAFRRAYDDKRLVKPFTFSIRDPRE